ncbi:DNA-directed RNA polymerase III subunit RPC4 [Brachionus plicatilis]|uniref:DNA-directed RNA polymerase III subunit RPC4 n=1 Tax=Brachionus plicatilis TaxID=10195 RepID=A0A3M7SKE9_BRAPC|nr:DNA-directed RNA polymerase III subunit RPC4 [Brachionus plicatilis]
MSDASKGNSEPNASNGTGIKKEPEIPTSSKSSSGPPKRVFVPNLSIDRTKKEVKAEPDQPRQEKNKQRRPVAPNLAASRGRNRNQNLIQSHSIFEAGPAESTKRFANKDQSETGYTKVVGQSLRSSVGEKREPEEPTITRHRAEQNVLIKESKEDDYPMYIKLKYDVKEESNVLGAKDLEDAKTKDEQILKNTFFPDDYLERSKEKLVLFQLPENLQLNELNEGKIGKIRIRKSGKIDMLFNDDKYLNVCLSVSAPFLQNAVGVDIEDDQEIGKMFSLGEVKNKIVCSPKF